MRTAFIRALERLAEEDPRIVLMTGDLGFGVLDAYRAKHADQFLNVGVAEQNLAGVAAGLALTGHIVFTYSIGNFPTLRCLEQIRNDICYHRADVKIVSVGGGMAYGALGPSHFATEDLAIMRVLPDMTVVAPGDPYEVSELVPQIAALQGPVYLRLGRTGEPRIHPPGTVIRLGQPTPVRDGGDVVLLTTGSMLPVAMSAASDLETRGVNAKVVSMHTLRPLNADALIDLVRPFSLLVTCEEHTVLGGLGGAVGELILEAGVATRLRRFGLPPTFPNGVGDQTFLRECNGLDAAHLARSVWQWLEGGG